MGAKVRLVALGHGSIVVKALPMTLSVASRANAAVETDPPDNFIVTGLSLKGEGTSKQRKCKKKDQWTESH